MGQMTIVPGQKPGQQQQVKPTQVQLPPQLAQLHQQLVDHAGGPHARPMVDAAVQLVFGVVNLCLDQAGLLGKAAELVATPLEKQAESAIDRAMGGDGNPETGPDVPGVTVDATQLEQWLSEAITGGVKSVLAKAAQQQRKG